MATHSSVLAWRIPGMAEPGGLPSMQSHRVGHDWRDLAAAAAAAANSIFKSRNITLPTKVFQVKALVFPVVTYGCKSWTVKKNECRRIDDFELEKTLESPLGFKEIQPVHSKWNQSWVYIRRNDAKAETPIRWPPHVKSWLIEKDSDVGRDWGQEEKGMTEEETTNWHPWLDGCDFEWTPGVCDGQGGLACCNSWGRKESDTTELLNWTDSNTGGYGMLLNNAYTFWLVITCLYC